MENQVKTIARWMIDNQPGFNHTNKILSEILMERVRVQAEENYTIEGDDAAEFGKLLDGAAAYLMREPTWWPYGHSTFKPSNYAVDLSSKARRRDLIKAAQMLVAEIEKMDRATGGTNS